MSFTFTQFVIMFITVYMGLYILIERILKCIEHCTEVKVFSKYMKKSNDIFKDIAVNDEED